MTNLKIAVIGDVHDQWEIKDHLALKHLGVDLVLFVGDLGNESVEIVQLISSLDIPYAVILGNHDAWFTATPWGRKKAPYNHAFEDRVQQQLELLGKCHVGYQNLDFPQFNLSVVGGRPFSWGGSKWTNKDFYRKRYNINNFQESQDRIVQAGLETGYETILCLGHNGPLGLGDAAEDICGKDWEPRGGDFGDPDFSGAIATLRSHRTIPLVAFGHMHHRLRHTKHRLRTRLNQDEYGTVYLNAACVPRIIVQDQQTLRNFSLVSLSHNQVSEVSLVWVGEDHQIVSQERLTGGLTINKQQTTNNKQQTTTNASSSVAVKFYWDLLW